MNIPNNINPPSLNYKEPWLAVNLSTFLAGVGQIYTGNVVKGWLFILIQILLYLSGVGLVFSAKGDTRIGILLFFAAIIFGIVSLFDAYKSAVDKNKPEFESIRKSNKDPWKAVFLSRIIPGVGQIYNGNKFIGIFILIVWAFLSFLRSNISIITVIPQIIVTTAIAYHAYISSPIKRELSKKAIMIISSLLIVTPLLSFPIGIAAKTYVAESRYIASNSMLPTLQINDRLIINKWDYHFKAPQRKDIVVFLVTDTIKEQSPTIKSTDVFIQRLIGLPGETVEIKQGKVFINDQPLQEDYILEPIEYQFDAKVIPPNSYFVLGDTRNNSFDSHIWGFLPKANIIGKAVKIFFPFERQKIL